MAIWNQTIIPNAVSQTKNKQALSCFAKMINTWIAGSRKRARRAYWNHTEDWTNADTTSFNDVH
jgi:hypothetical protein